MKLPKGLNTQIRDLAHTTLRQMGGVATIEDASQHIYASLSNEERKALALPGIAAIVATSWREIGDLGLPMAPAVDVHGTHMQLALFSVDDYRFVITECLRSKRRFQKRAEQYHDACASVHGVDIDLGAIEAGLAI